MLFGSFAKGTAHAESDIDLAYFSDKKLTAYERFNLAGELAIIASCEVDLADIKKTDTVFTMQIFEQGLPIYIKDENEFTRQKIRAYSMYATLNEQRAPIIDAIKERGSVFGDE
jgi:predicted nucleotidyltransferase